MFPFQSPSPIISASPCMLISHKAKEEKTVVTKTDCGYSHFSFHLWKLSVIIGRDSKLALALSKHWWAACKPHRHTKLYASCCVPSCRMPFEVLQPTGLHEEWAKTGWGCQMAYYRHVSALTTKTVIDLWNSNSVMGNIALHVWPEFSPQGLWELLERAHMHLVSVRDWHVQRK